MAKQRVSRRAQRFSVRLEVKEFNGKPGAGIFIVDLSALGAKVESPTPLAPRNQVEMSFSLPGGHGEVRAVGTVAWVRPIMTQSGRYLLGVKFFNSFWDIDQLGRSGKLQ
jgi:hypothetical protein